MVLDCCLQAVAASVVVGMRLQQAENVCPIATFVRTGTHLERKRPNRSLPFCPRAQTRLSSAQRPHAASPCCDRLLAAPPGDFGLPAIILLLVRWIFHPKYQKESTVAYV